MNKTNKQRSRPEDGAETRLLILRTGRELFMTYGYRAVSTRQIAQACGLTQPAMYRHFRDKEALYIEVLQHELDLVNREVTGRIRHAQGDHAAALRLLARYLAEIPHDLGWMFHDLEHEIKPESRELLQRAFRVKFQLPIADVFREAFNRGDFHSLGGRLSPEAAAMLFLGSLKQRPGEAADTAWPDTVTDLLLYGISASR